MRESIKNNVKYYLVFFFAILFSLCTFFLERVNATESFPFIGVVNDYGANMYDPATANYVTDIAYGTRVKVNRSLVDSRLKKVCSVLYEIEYDQKLMYVCSSLITNVNENTTTSNIAGIETYQNYCKTLKDSGFPESYCPYLYYLHGKYPKWKFKADNVGLTLEDISKNEENKCALALDNPNYRLSQIPHEGSYYWIRSDVIASFMDPRNSLFENRIFQYLDLQQSKDIVNDDTLKYVAGNGGYLNNFLNEFKQAGISNNINPVHVLARSKQEGPNRTNPIYSGVKGTYTTDNGLTSSQGFTLDGYFNFFNIGSYMSGYYTSTVQRGMAYAAGFTEDDRCMTVDENGKAFYEVGKTYEEKDKNGNVHTVTCGMLSYQRPWDTPQKAILGGTDFIANDYVRTGQDTLYYQKFNISSYASRPKYSHQYMTNIAAPQSEGKMMYTAYSKGNLLNSEFSFTIPVFMNMSPEVVQPENKSMNNYLKSITINGVSLPGFDRDRVEYNYSIVTNNNSFKVSATLEDSKAKITSGIGSVNFVNGSAKVSIVVTAENGKTNTYVINVKQVRTDNEVKVNEIVAKMGVKVNGNIMYGISPGYQVETLIKSVSNNKGSASVVNSSGKNKVSGNLATGDKITIKGTKDSLTYTIAVRGDASGDGVIKINDLILLQSQILGKISLKDEKYFAADVNYDGVLKINDLILIQSNILGKVNL